MQNNRETGSTVDRAERSARSTQLLPVHVGGRWAMHGSSLHPSQFHFFFHLSFSITPFLFSFFFFLNFAEFSFANFCVLHFFLENFFVPVFFVSWIFFLEILCSNFYLQVFPKKTFISKFLKILFPNFYSNFFFPFSAFIIFLDKKY